jgi:hypothetical protein
VWRFLVFKHNQHEIDKAKSLANELGVEIAFEKPYVYPNFEQWASTIEKFRPVNFSSSNEENSLQQTEQPADNTRILNSKLVLPKSCDWLWFMPIINGNGNVSPCCITTFDKEDFGNIKEDKLISILNNKKFVNARKLVSGQEIEPNLNLICEKCPGKEIWHNSDETITIVFESLLLKLSKYYPQVKDLTVNSIDWNVFQKLKEMVISQVKGIEHNEHDSSSMPDVKKTSGKLKILSWLKSKKTKSTNLLLSHKILLHKLYNEMLGRDADNLALDYFLPLLEKKEISENDIRKIIINSEEYKHKNLNTNLL